MQHIRHIILPDSGSDLLREELDLAFCGLGLAVTRLHPDVLLLEAEAPVPDVLSNILADGPALLLSINFQGLFTLRPLLDLFEHHGGTIAAWCVDNPWNILAGVRDPRWKTLPLFVTDASFIPALQREGAQRVHHLPLAASPAHSRAQGEKKSTQELAPFVFVGRSAFPGKNSFFAGVSLPDGMLDTARTLLREGKRPDLLWWEEHLFIHRAAAPQAAINTPAAQHGSLNTASEAQARIHAHRAARTAPAAEQKSTTPAHFWPGKNARLPALGAEETALHWRALCLRAAADAGMRLKDQTPSGFPTHGLDIFGDEGWTSFLPQETHLHPPVDYYGSLFGIYAQARFSLCLTSMQLPHGLNQRHFDIWMAGGLALTDATPGLALFPEDLVRPIRFNTPSDIETAANRAEQYPGGRGKLIADWQTVIQERHTYTHRATAILEKIFD